MAIKPWTKNCVCGREVYTQTALGGEGSGKFLVLVLFCLDDASNVHFSYFNRLQGSFLRRNTPFFV